MTQEQVIEAIELKRQREVSRITVRRCPGTKTWMYWLTGDDTDYYFDEP